MIVTRSSYPTLPFHAISRLCWLVTGQREIYLFAVTIELAVATIIIARWWKKEKSTQHS